MSAMMPKPRVSHADYDPYLLYHINLKRPVLEESMKLCCIGLSKTGTTSLMVALEMLGYASAHWHYTRNVFRYTAQGIEVRFDKFTDHDAFGDTPIARIYP